MMNNCTCDGWCDGLCLEEKMTNEQEVLKDMPVVTVEQVHRFRMAALKAVDQEAAKVAMLVEVLQKVDAYLTPRISNSGVEGRTKILPLVKNILSATAPKAEAFIREKQAEALEEAAEVFSTIGHSKFKTRSDELRHMSSELRNAKEV